MTIEKLDLRKYPRVWKACPFIRDETSKFHGNVLVWKLGKTVNKLIEQNEKLNRRIEQLEKARRRQK